jgi:hypothetical protein
LTVQEAYRQRAKKPRRAAVADGRSEKPTVDLTDFLLGVCKQADFYADQADFVEPEQATKFLTMIDETIAELNKMRSLFHRRVSA